MFETIEAVETELRECLTAVEVMDDEFYDHGSCCHSCHFGGDYEEEIEKYRKLSEKLIALIESDITSGYEQLLKLDDPEYTTLMNKIVSMQEKITELKNSRFV